MKRQINKDIIVFEKTRNIASALYLITDLIPEHDPIRTKLREKAVEAVTVIVLDREGSRTDFYLIGKGLNPRLFGICSLLDIAHVTGLVSDMNYRIISEELSKLMDFISSICQPRKVDEILGNNEPLIKPESKKWTTDKIAGFLYRTTNETRDIIKGHSIGHLRKQELKNLETGDKDFFSSIARKEAILSELKNTDSMSVRDFMSVIKNVSDKTIQRSLTSLVKDKAIKKTGEKRWSRYSIAG